jgi:hypothetical protein
VGTFRRAGATALAAFALVLTACSGLVATEATPTVDPLANPHTGEAVFEGTVTGYEPPEGTFCLGSDDTTCVAVDGAAVSLALIDTWEITCHDGAGLDEQLALDMKQQTLPVGARVNVVRDLAPDADYYEMSGFIHVLDEAGAADPVSANESLVATGYWVPDYQWSNSQQVGNYRPSTNWVTGEDSSSGDLLYERGQKSLTSVQAEYGQRILEAANAARVLRVGGQETCMAQVDQLAEEDAAGAARYNESSRRLELEYEQWKRDHPGWGRCIDGDGDGVCYER